DRERERDRRDIRKGRQGDRGGAVGACPTEAFHPKLSAPWDRHPPLEGGRVGLPKGSSGWGDNRRSARCQCSTCARPPPRLARRCVAARLTRADLPCSEVVSWSGASHTHQPAPVTGAE